jgi:hypothetical protein
VELAVKRGDPASGFPYNTTDWASQYFKTHPELISDVAPWNPLAGLP